MKRILIYLLLSLNITLFAQDTVKISKTIKVHDTIYKKKIVKVVDTIYINETNLISHDTLNQTLIHSEYNKLLDQVLHQKQENYDTALSNLQWINSIFGILITIIIFIFGFLGYSSITNIRKSIKEKLDDEKVGIENKIKAEAKQITTLRYDSDITELKEKIMNLERFAEDASNSFTLKKGKEKPELKEKITTPNPVKNPFPTK